MYDQKNPSFTESVFNDLAAIVVVVEAIGAVCLETGS